MANSVGQAFKDPNYIASNGSADITYAADEWREINAMLGTGGLRDNTSFSVVTAAGGLGVTFGPGMALVPGTSQGAKDISGITPQGFYIAHLTANATLTFAPGPSGAGQSRTDLVVVRIYDAAVTGSGLKEAKLEVVQGTPGIPGLVPSVPASSVKVAAVGLTQNSSSITGIGVSDDDTNQMLVSSTFRTISLPPALVGRFMDLTSAQTITGAKTFSGGIARGSGPVRGVNRVFAKTTHAVAVPSTSFASPNTGWVYVPFEGVEQYVHDNGFTYSTGASRINLDGGSYRVSGLVTVNCGPNAFAACRIKTAGGSIQFYDRRETSQYDTSVTIPFACDFQNYQSSFWLEVKQQSDSTRNVLIDDNDALRCFISVVGDA